MKITIYELLGLIKDGKAPTKFKYKNRVFYLVDNDYWCDEIGGWFSVEVLDISILNDEVEIIEEDKKIEKIDKRVLSQNLMIANPNAPIDEKWKLVQKLIYDNSIEIEKVKNKLNELIEEIEKLKENK